MSKVREPIPRGVLFGVVPGVVRELFWRRRAENRHECRAGCGSGGDCRGGLDLVMMVMVVLLWRMDVV